MQTETETETEMQKKKVTERSGIGIGNSYASLTVRFLASCLRRLCTEQCEADKLISVRYSYTAYI